MDEILYKLKDFEGPLDLLIHLINKNKLDIKEIKIGILLEQYMNHIDQMEKLGIRIKGEFLDMISRLIYIKTLSLLPKSEEEEILREELSAELIEHQRLKVMSKIIFEKINFNSFVRYSENIPYSNEFNGRIKSDIFIKCYVNICKNFNPYGKKIDSKIQTITSRKIVSVRGMVIFILRKIKKLGEFSYCTLFHKKMSKSCVVAVFLAVLELIKLKRVKINKDLIKQVEK